MEELLQWFGFGEFSPKQLIPARKLSSRSTEAPFSSDTISYQESVPPHYLWRVVRNVIKSLDLEGTVNRYVTLPPEEQLQEIVTRRFVPVLWYSTLYALLFPVYSIRINSFVCIFCI